MIKLNLAAESKEENLIKDYLEQNVSEILANKINNGVCIEKDGKTLLNKKTLDDFMKYACEQAKEQSEKTAVSACIESKTVFGWAVHYFEEDSIQGTLYNEDGKPYKNIKTVAVSQKTAAKPIQTPKPQMSLFDLVDNQEKTEIIEPQIETQTKTDFEDNNVFIEEEQIPIKAETITDSDDDYEFTDEEIQEALRELSQEFDEIATSIDFKTGEIIKKPKDDALEKLKNLFGEQMIVR